MISAQQAVDIALDAAARRGRADETIVLVTDRMAASLRWANNSMTTNGASIARSTTVISIVRQGNTARVGSLTSSEVDPSVIEGLVVASQAAAMSAPDARDAAPLLSGNGSPANWDAPTPGTGPEVFADVARGLSRAFRGSDQLYGFARHGLETVYLATSGGLRRRYTQPTGTVEINAKRDGASAWVAVGTPDFTDVPTDLIF
ncbi:MAG: TldD/PmbA family protein, partial [Mycobacterium sp.]|nr:TldD/PmbA family protein [Mycobacterium sp.]